MNARAAINAVVSLIFLSCLSDPAMAQSKAAKHVNQSVNSKVSIEFESFAKPRELVDEAFEFASPAAESLWNFLISKVPGLPRAGGYMILRDSGEFAALGPDSYLVLLDAFYFAKPKSDSLTQLTRAWPPGNVSLSELRFMPGNDVWLLIGGEALSHGISSKGFYSLFISSNSPGAPSVRSVELASFYETVDGLCDGGALAESDNAAHLDDYLIKDVNNDGLEDIVFYVEEQDCRTKQRRKVTRVFLNNGKSFLHL